MFVVLTMFPTFELIFILCFGIVVRGFGKRQVPTKVTEFGFKVCD